MAIKRNPALARTDVDSGDRFYLWKGEAFWSVTTLIGGGIPKYALAPWYAKVVAETVTTEILSRGPHSRAHALIRRWTTQGRADVLARQAAGELTSIKLDKLSPLDLAHRWLKGEPSRVRDAAADIGVAVHSEAEDAVLRLALDESNEVPIARQPWPESLAGYERAFDDWRARYEPIYVATEATVFNRPQAYAGTLDAIVKVRAGLVQAALRAATHDVGKPVPPWFEWIMLRDPDELVQLVLDYKAGKNVHPEVGLQLAAYSRAEFIGLPDGLTEATVPMIDGGAVLHLTPTGYHLRLVRIDEPVYDAFRFAREVYRFSKQMAGTVLGPDLAPSQVEAAA